MGRENRTAKECIVRLIKRLGRSLLHLLVGLVIVVGSAIGLLIFFVGSVLFHAARLLWYSCLLLHALFLLILNPEPRDGSCL